MNKKFVKTLVAIGVCAVLPISAQGADRIDIKPIQVGDRVITTQFDNAAQGEWYHLYVGNVFLSGRLNEEDVKAGQKNINIPTEANLINGTVIRFEMPSYGNTYLKTDRAVGDKQEGEQEIGKELRVVYPKTVRPGEQVVPKILYVKDGVTKDVGENAAYSYKGPIAVGSFNRGGFKVASDAAVGATISMTVMYGEERATVTLRVAEDSETKPPTEPSKPIQSGKLSQDKKDLPVGDATVTLTPNQWPAGATRAYLDVRYKSNPNAVLTVQISNIQTLAEDKKVIARLTSTANTTASYNIVFNDAAGKELSRLPFDVRFGKSSVSNGQVKMTIGLKLLEVGKETKTTDTAPFIQNNRTFIPLRALVEAFGAKVDYNNASQAIKIESGKDKVHMMIGKTNYTVNGATRYMDSAPYLSNGGRTIVPVRFVAEALGYKIDITTDREGLTQTVIFHRS